MNTVTASILIHAGKNHPKGEFCTALETEDNYAIIRIGNSSLFIDVDTLLIWITELQRILDQSKSALEETPL